MDEGRDLSTFEVRNLLLETLAYEGDDIDSEKKNFKKYGYQGTKADLYRLAENLALKQGLIQKRIEVSGAAWGSSGPLLWWPYSTNFSNEDIKKIYEQFNVLINQGIIAPGAIGNYGDALPSFHVTEYGLKCLKEKEILPYDVDGYFSQLEEIEGLSEWVKFYVMESLRCYNSDCLEAAVIMLGLANEEIIKELCDSIINSNFPHHFYS